MLSKVEHLASMAVPVHFSRKILNLKVACFSNVYRWSSDKF